MLELALALWWVLSQQIYPANDQEMVWQMAEALATGDFSAYGSDSYGWVYFQTCPYQGAMALFMEPFIRLFGDGALRAWSLFGAISAPASLLALCCSAKEFGAKPRTQLLCAVLCLLFVPIPMYASFVYGTLPAPAMVLWGGYGVLRFIKGGKPGWLVLPFFNRAPIPYSSGMPASATVLMGIHSGTYYGPGGYDASSWELFWANNYDTNTTNAAAVKGIREYIATYLRNPKEVKFFLQKTAWQWLDPWFEALTMNGPSITVAGGAGWLATALAGGVLFAPVQALLRALLTFVYLFAGVGTLELRRKTDGSVWAQLLGIAFFGGFLFQLVWETKSRYCFPFFVFLLPLAALGFTAALRRAGERLAK